MNDWKQFNLNHLDDTLFHIGIINKECDNLIDLPEDSKYRFIFRKISARQFVNEMNLSKNRGFP